MSSHKTKIFDDWLHYFFVIFAFIVLVALLVISTLVDSVPVKVMASLGTLFFTAYLSYEFTKVSVARSSREELRRLGETSGRHIFLLANQIRDLGEEVSKYVPDGDKSQIRFENISSQLNKMASQAEVSFYDMQKITGLEISLEKIASEARSALQITAKEETVTCPHCKNQIKELVDTSPGTNLLRVCPNCHKTFNIIRKGDGTIRIAFSGVYAFPCPNCHSQITLKRRERDYGVVVRNCFECYARIKFDLDNQAVVSHEIEEPLTITTSQIEEDVGKCPYCSWNVTFSKGRNNRGERLQFCPSCTRLIKVVEG
jgi:ssDNA-binding Zn-finger/Zn-ribbon topoisomerase 1